MNLLYDKYISKHGLLGSFGYGVLLFMLTLTLSWSSFATAAAPVFPEIVSVNTAGVPALSASGGFISVSQDARYVLFASSDPSLDPTVTVPSASLPVYYLRDRTLRTTKLATKNSSGQVLNAGVELAKLSGDGNHVVFTTQASNVGVSSPLYLDPGVYELNLTTGSIEILGNQTANFSITRNGQVYLNRLVSGDGSYTFNGNYRQNVASGVQEEVFTTSTDGSPIDSSALLAKAASYDGRYVVYATNSTNILNVPLACAPNICGHLYWHDMVTNQTKLVDVDANGQVFYGLYDRSELSVSMSDNGQLVGFGYETPNSQLAYVWNASTGKSKVVSQVNGNQVTSVGASLSGDGLSVAFGGRFTDPLLASLFRSQTWLVAVN